MTDDDIQAYLEIKRPLCCGFNEIKEYLESNIVLCCGPEDTSELDKYLGTSNAPECLLELTNSSVKSHFFIVFPPSCI